VAEGILKKNLQKLQKRLSIRFFLGKKIPSSADRTPENNHSSRHILPLKLFWRRSFPTAIYLQCQNEPTGYAGRE
jgi:hypothetical protein